MNFKKSVTALELKEAYSQLITGEIGDLKAIIDNFTSVKLANSSSFVFANSEVSIRQALASAASCILAPEKMREKIAKNQPAKTLLFCKNVDLLARNIKKDFCQDTPYRSSLEGIADSAFVHPSVELGKGIVIGPNAVINEKVKIGDDSFIGANTVIEAGVTIGKNATIHPLVYIGHSSEIGDNFECKSNTTIASEGYGYAHDHLGNHYRIPHTGRVVIHDDVHIGANCSIDRGTIEDSVIGRGTKIDNQVHFGHNLVIGKNGLVTANAVTAGSCKIGDNFISGGLIGLGGHLEIADNVNLAGFAAVTKSIDKPGAYGGNPLEPLKDALRNKVSFRYLTDMRKKIDKLWEKFENQ